jgi:hypothetical protein
MYPHHVTGIMEFESGVIGTIFTTFDVWQAELPASRSTAPKAPCRCPIPTTSARMKRYGCFRPGSDGFKEIPVLFPYTENSRALGLADMAKAIQTDAVIVPTAIRPCMCLRS